MKDEVFAKPGREADFKFDQKVAEVFDDMVARSVPQYAVLQSLMADLVVGLHDPTAIVYDIGCSTGNTLLGLARRPALNGVRMIGLDSSEEMLNIAREKVGAENSTVSFQRCHVDEKTVFENAGTLVLCLTLQFIRPIQRLEFMENIVRQLRPGGVVLVIEKTILVENSLNRVFIETYHGMKEANGYSKTEIARKRLALENILIPYTATENLQLMKRAGLTECATFFQWLNFSGMVGVK